MTPALVAAVAIVAALWLCWVAGYAAAERHHYARTATLRRRLYVALVTVERLRAERAEALAVMDPWVEFDGRQR